MAQQEKLNKRYRLLIESSIGSGEFIEITNPITIKFTISRQTYSGANSMNLSIYNLGEKNQKVIFHDTYDTEHIRTIILEAGYDTTGMSLIFIGSMVSAYTTKQGSNIVTKIYALDGALQTQTAMTSQTFLNYKLKDLITIMARSIPGLDIGKINVQEEKMSKSVVLWGNTYDLIQKYTDGRAFIDLQKIYVLGDYDVLEGNVPLITSNNGLLGVPERRNASLNVSLIFEPRIIVGQVVQIESKIAPQFDGQYKVTGLTHQAIISDSSLSMATTTLDLWIGEQTHGGQWNVVK